MRLLVGVAALAMAGCAATPAELAQQQETAARQQDRLAHALAGLTPERSTTCLSTPAVPTRTTEIYGSTLLYREGRNRVYRNDLSGGCSPNPDDIIVTRTPTAQLCRGDIVQFYDRASRFPTDSCALGDFVPYRKARS